MTFEYFTGYFRGNFEIVKDKAEKLHSVYTFLKTTKKRTNVTFKKAASVAFSMTLGTMKYYLINFLNKTVVKVPGHSNDYEVSYVIRGKLYKMIVTPKKGPTHIAFIFDQDDNDVSETIFPYLGPRYDFHHSHLITPKYLGFEKLKFIHFDGFEKEFSEDDILALN